MDIEEPSKPKYYTLWSATSTVCFISFMVFGKDLLDDTTPIYSSIILLFVGLFVVCSILACKKLRQYEAEYAIYLEQVNELKRQQRIEEEYKKASVSKVNENIERYLQEQKARKEGAKWWQFWV